MMFRRRRPLLRAAMVGGVGYMAGKSVARGSERESEEQQRIAELVRDAGGFHLADAWVHPADLIAVGLIAAEDGALQ